MIPKCFTYYIHVVFYRHFCRTHRTHRAPRRTDVHICTHRRTLCAPRSDVHTAKRSDVHTGKRSDVHTGKCVYPQSQKQQQRQKRTLKVVKLLIKLFYLVTVIITLTTTLSGKIAANDDKYNSVFCLQKHCANSLPQLNNVSVPTFLKFLVNMWNINAALPVPSNFGCAMAFFILFWVLTH